MPPVGIKWNRLKGPFPVGSRSSSIRAASSRSAVRAEVAGRLQVGAQTQGGLGAGVGAVDDQPARRPHAVDDLGGAEPAQDVPLQRGDGQVHTGFEERGEGGVGVAEGGVAFAERHRVRASQ